MSKRPLKFLRGLILKDKFREVTRAGRRSAPQAENFQKIIQNLEPSRAELVEVLYNPKVSTVSRVEKVSHDLPEEAADSSKRNFLKIAGVAGVGLIASQLFPKSADALVMGSTPSSSVVGVKDDSNTRINPATEESVAALLTGQGVTKLSISLAASGNVRTPASGKKIRIYASRFSLTADATSVSFRFTAGGTDHEKYVSPKVGGLYGANNHPNYVEGGVDEVLYCVISGTTTVQINIDYLEV